MYITTIALQRFLRTSATFSFLHRYTTVVCFRIVPARLLPRISLPWTRLLTKFNADRQQPSWGYFAIAQEDIRP